MLKCAILDDYHNCAFALADWHSLQGVESTNFTEVVQPGKDRAADLADYEILVAMRERTKIDADLLERLPKVKLIVTTGKKNEAIDIAAATKRGIVVCGTKSLATPAPELAWGLLLTTARNISQEAANFREGGWQTTIGLGLAGKTLGIVGFGKIGVRVARVAKAFDMQVIAWQPRPDQAAVTAAGAELAKSLEDLMERSDFVSVHMVLAESTRGLIGAKALSKMKPTAILVNDSRGPVVDEAALIEVLKEKKIAGAALDVYDTEPLPADRPFRTLTNVVATPHLGYVTMENYRLFYTEAVEDIKAWLLGTPLRVLPCAL